MKQESKLPRREFLANLLFCGTALSVTGLQSSYDLVARRDPKKDGWELPEDKLKPRPEDDGWELPEDLLETTDPPKPPPRPPRPHPHPQGRVRRPDGGVRLPEPPGKVTPPPSGDVQPRKPQR